MAEVEFNDTGRTITGGMRVAGPSVIQEVASPWAQHDYSYFVKKLVASSSDINFRATNVSKDSIRGTAQRLVENIPQHEQSNILLWAVVVHIYLTREPRWQIRDVITNQGYMSKIINLFSRRVDYKDYAAIVERFQWELVNYYIVLLKALKDPELSKLTQVENLVDNDDYYEDSEESEE